MALTQKGDKSNWSLKNERPNCRERVGRGKERRREEEEEGGVKQKGMELLNLSMDLWFV